MKRHEIKRTPLAETVLRSPEPEDKLYRIKDGSNQLHFTVAANGSKRWEVSSDILPELGSFPVRQVTAKQ
ncbi:MAG: hypothetical protein SV429_06260 [Pseudomonadota bacterium]|nr:hypothetical protein [Pseudomonadota bacterium]